MKTKLRPVSIFFLAAFSILITTNSSAQKTSFGLKGGVNSASLDVDNGVDFDSKTGLHFGGLAHIHVAPHFAIQPELVYSCQGGERPTYDLKLGYLNVPVLLQYMVGSGFRLQTGPQLGFLISAEQEAGDVEIDVDDAFDGLDFSWSLGAGYMFNSGLGIDLRYNIGLTDINEAGTAEIKNRVLQLGLFYQFNNNNRTRK